MTLDEKKRQCLTETYNCRTEYESVQNKHTRLWQYCSKILSVKCRFGFMRENHRETLPWLWWSTHSLSILRREVNLETHEEEHFERAGQTCTDCRRNKPIRKPQIWRRQHDKQSSVQLWNDGECHHMNPCCHKFQLWTTFSNEIQNWGVHITEILWRQEHGSL